MQPEINMLVNPSTSKWSLLNARLPIGFQDLFGGPNSQKQNTHFANESVLVLNNSGVQWHHAEIHTRYWNCD
jgi:hypothetical protein